jgi:predicted RNA-binding Zn-ribbon protein involved in translation (DUF1610 family)
MDVNLISLIEKYGSDDSKCREYLETLKWMGKIKCPRCGSDKISRIKKVIVQPPPQYDFLLAFVCQIAYLWAYGNDPCSQRPCRWHG